MSEIHISKAVNTLKTGGVIAYPTEAVWGLGCNPYDKQAFQTILTLKGRPLEKGVILISGVKAHFAQLLEPLTEAQRALVESHWPGPTTFLLPDSMGLPSWIKGRFSTVACRFTQHPLVGEVTRRFGAPIVSTSANPGGRPPARSSFQVRRYFTDQLDYILPGQTSNLQSPSQIIDLRTGKRLR
ncbi:threonine-dependent ADP-forming ATPase of tRNA(ANN) t(6)A37 threonylcarbamoyladenosine biosynthesis complex [Oleiphilus messinensis]|uniref:Threonylcarbamoyl-AMP synthase n=1 Tax=Oleiphilus messinensis TaxID=141451 RepID=A0A1Y0I115_9GAMM|nr:L-threonylcarbamoyladenylate synthase [Oleiphilus messinensis]ARU54147.1 threonine-dependent ADP-forming ATPase of tRNA(ANN) t(6)A37 threonylcarbamoyladenosine biosynthesis complex [Oleiphilus messinensis]